MQLKYGSYAWAANSVTIATDIQETWNEGGQLLERTWRAHVTGYLAVNGQADCTQQMSAMDTALKVPYQDFVLLQDSGAQSATLLLNSGSITGVRVTHGPNFPKSDGAEYATERYFEFDVEASYPMSFATNFLVRFRETLEGWGGGPQYNVLPALNTPGQRQLIYPLVPFEGVQRGEAVGYLAYPPALPPIWPFALNEPGKITRRDPQRRGKGYSEYPVSWEYHYKWPFPLVGFPNRWLG